MPLIRVYSYSGRDEETKKALAVALAKTANEKMGAPLSAFTVMYEDVEREVWDEYVVKTIIDPNREQVLIDHDLAD
ncbi:MAG: 4-oxalocrotonate tautomerase family protein [Coriobacteriales bacterium]|jgi:phenylpyruvate tautomerase PptA (4-oxalocrotonate tautomerase family)|nr:4-oxalocrotonate tautomerase family protein [Coriobacteriales bacterium]